MRFAVDVPELELSDYQRTVRLVLRHPLITATWPDERALGRVRRFAPQLRQDLAEAFGYRLELHGSAARLVRTADQLDPSRPATSRTGRVFDRRRYAYLSLCLAALGRAGIQTTVSELADAVSADANRIGGLGLDPDSGGDRRAFVDAVGWLEERGVLRVADGSSSSWASDPGSGEALYDIARDALLALFHPPRVLQHVGGVAELLRRDANSSGNAERRAAAQAARRAIAEQPVLYYSDVAPEVANHLRGTALPADLYRLTGLRVERRAEGVLLVDTVGWSAERFPGAGSVAQAAVLLAVEMADRALDPDGRRVKRLPAPARTERHDRLVAEIDAGLPTASRVVLDDRFEPREPDTDADPSQAGGPAGNGASTGNGTSNGNGNGASTGNGTDAGNRTEAGNRTDAGNGTAEPARYPFVTDSFLREAVSGILQRYGSAFGATWHADPNRLAAEAVALLARFGAVTPVPGGVLVRPLVGRYRSTVATVRQRTLF
ncbi:TIGR02678 family protein [Plantactinospora sp. KBS50]|uniref:TIGR02678 family protein n=1 Tax=Plantactinospora sp. KBS50 TaxID=2024580 RepID=UPI001E3BF431|nr:TIGR02678 family protein [Plantactinospora sp. KBS50]